MLKKFSKFCALKKMATKEIRGVMYGIETFALSCRAINAVTLGDIIYLPLLLWQNYTHRMAVCRAAEIQ